VRECGRMRPGCGRWTRARKEDPFSECFVSLQLCIKIAIDKLAVQSETIGMRKCCLVVCLLLTGCAAKKHPVATAPPVAPPEVRSQLPPASAEVIEHCVVTKQENANTVTCSCLPGTTVIDSRTGHTRLVCKKMKEETGSK
jgi:hypothetical protein